MVTPAQIEAARRFAPPLMTVGRADRRGARLRSVNRRAIDYAQRAGFSLEDVYPHGLTAVRALAPTAGTPEAPAFVAAIGLPLGEIYPTSFSGESKSPWRWGWAVAGFAVGAMAGGPIWAVAGSLLGGFR
jgi:hypothetical protein